VPLLNTLTRCSGPIASQAPTSLPGFSGFQLDEVGACTKCIRRGRSLVRWPRRPASLGPRHPVCGIDHQVAVGVIDLQLDQPAAVWIMQSGDGTPVTAPNQVALGPVKLCRPDPAGPGEVLRRPRDRNHDGPVGWIGWLEAGRGGHSQGQPVDGCRAKREIRMEPDPERCWFRAGVDRLARHDEASLTQGIGDLEVELPLVSGLGVAQRTTA
jgi:hypothetical protein